VEPVLLVHSGAGNDFDDRKVFYKKYRYYLQVARQVWGQDTNLRPAQVPMLGNLPDEAKKI
jgi:hypothetical protein